MVCEWMLLCVLISDSFDANSEVNSVGGLVVQLNHLLNLLLNLRQRKKKNFEKTLRKKLTADGPKARTRSYSSYSGLSFLFYRGCLIKILFSKKKARIENKKIEYFSKSAGNRKSEIGKFRNSILRVLVVMLCNRLAQSSIQMIAECLRMTSHY